jgi:aquaporin Z
MNIRALVAEAVGTFILVGVGSVAILSSSASQLPPVLTVPFGFGLGLLVAIAATGHASGGHYNPAVTLAAVLDGRIDIKNALGYVVAQVVGAFVGSFLILLGVAKEAVAVTMTNPVSSLDVVKIFALETVFAAIFILVILTVTRKAPDLAILVIPLTLTVIHFALVPITGASVNPARSLAPAILAGDLTNLWIYLIAPFLGAIIGWGVYKFLAPASDDDFLDEVYEEFEVVEDAAAG